MNKFFKILFIPAFVFLAGTFISYGDPHLSDKNIVSDTLSPKPSNETEKPDYAFIEAFREHVYCNCDSAHCPGMATAIINNGKIEILETYGFRQNDTKEIITENTLFRIASVSKGFAGIVAAKLVNDGVIDLQKPVSYYVPEFKVRQKRGRDTIRVWHILSHTTGFTTHAFSNLIDQGKNMDVLVKAINRLDVRDYPGKSYAYQNAAFAMIEKIIEKTTGVAYSKMLDSIIFKPLGMVTASTSHSAISAANDRAFGHKYYGPKSGIRSLPIKPNYYNTISAGGVNATIQDMAIWLKAVMGYNPDIISDEVRELAFAPRANSSSDSKYFNRWKGRKASYYGLGWRIIEFQDRKLIFHGGSVNGFRTEIAFDPEKNIGVVFLFNSTCSYSNNAVPSFFSFYDKYYKIT
ncbi:MAG: beta-lactamase family protein [Saprospiraceae bacterium]|nr:beta-lactamase family protein [Saprospiraceae bacterium]